MRDIKKRWAMIAKTAAAPSARAYISGAAGYSSISGTVDFYSAHDGTLVVAQISGLPDSAEPCAANIYAMHMHENGTCDMEDAFAGAGGHYNPGGCEHPSHSGDMPPLFSYDGDAFSAFYTERFSVGEAVGRAVIVHAGADDFTSQPAGNSGARIACGTVRWVV